MSFKALLDRFESRITGIRRFLPALAFFCGFAWDSITMGRMVSFYDLLILTTYYFAAALILILLVREIQPQWQTGFTFLVQFCFGGLFSALVVFYFKSSGSFYTFIVVIALVLLLVSNEFLSEKYRTRTMSWTMFTICGTMYLNFLIPHIAHSIKAVWFYLSCTLSLAIVFAIHIFASGKQRQSVPIEKIKTQYLIELREMAPSLGVVIVLVALYQFQFIPPVPLVLKDSHICKDFSDENGVYQCQAEKQSFWQTLGIGGDVIHFQKGEKIYNLSAVFAPTDIAVDLEQRWWFQDENRGTWLARGVIPLSMVGGRKQGWRTYSFIHTSVQAGRWKTETALKDGAVLAIDYFTAKDQVTPTPQTHTVTVD